MFQSTIPEQHVQTCLILMIHVTQSKDFNLPCLLPLLRNYPILVPCLGLVLYGWERSVALQLPVSEGSASMGSKAGMDIQLESLQDTYTDLKVSHVFM